MENNNRNDQLSKELSLDEMLDVGIDDILNDLPDLSSANVTDEELRDISLEDTAKLLEQSDETAEEERRAARKQSKKEKKEGNMLLTYLHDLVYLLAGLVLLFLLLFRVVVVSGTSMNNTLYDGDWLLVLSNTLYHNPEHGDVIVASKQSFDNGAPIVKRVIATEGQKVDIDFISGTVYVDDVALDESYTLTPTNEQEGVMFPLIVEEGCLFVMGDNRNGSKDSRHPEIGQIDKREVLGKVFFLFFPGTNYDRVTRDYARIGVID